MDNFNQPEPKVLDYDNHLESQRSNNYFNQLQDEGYGSSQEIMEEIAAAQGISLEELAAILNEGGVPSEGGQPKGKPVKGKPTANQPFQPIQFKGNYDELGELAVEIKSKEQLEGYLEKALLAEKVYEKYEALEAEIDENREYIELGKTLSERMENEPLAVAGELVADLFYGSNGDTQGVVNHLAKLYHYFNNQLEDTQGYRLNQMQWEAKYKQPKVENQGFQEERSKLQEERNKFHMEVENKKLENWKSGMLSKYADIINHVSTVSGDNKWFDKQISLVLEKGLNQVRSGKTFTPKMLEAELRDLIGPIYSVFKKGAKPGTTGNKANTAYKPAIQGGQTNARANSGEVMEALKKKYIESLYER